MDIKQHVCLLTYLHITYFDRFCHPARQSIPPYFDVFWQILPSSKTIHSSSLWRILTGFHHPARQFIPPYFDVFCAIQQNNLFHHTLTYFGRFHHPARQFIPPYFDVFWHFAIHRDSLFFHLNLHFSVSRKPPSELWRTLGRRHLWGPSIYYCHRLWDLLMELCAQPLDPCTASRC